MNINELILRGIGKAKVRKAFNQYIATQISYAHACDTDIQISMYCLGINEFLGLEDAEITFKEVYNYLARK